MNQKVGNVIKNCQKLRWRNFVWPSLALHKESFTKLKFNPFLETSNSKYLEIKFPWQSISAMYLLGLIVALILIFFV